MNHVVNLWRWIKGEERSTNSDNAPSEHFRVVIAHECLDAIAKGIEPERAARQEGVLYLLGITNGQNSLLAGAVRPYANTTSGSFDVSSRSMAAVVRIACNAGLHVAGQLHTHPGIAYHSRGDELGARIRFPGFTSIVLPSYGDGLPNLEGAAVFVADSKGAFRELGDAEVTILPRNVLWRT